MVLTSSFILFIIRVIERIEIYLFFKMCSGILRKLSKKRIIGQNSTLLLTLEILWGKA